MSTETNAEGLAPERVEALLGRLKALGEYPYGNLSEAGSIMREAAATIAELRAELEEVEERLRDAGQEHDDMMVRLERAEAEVEEAKRNTQWRAVTAVSEENERLAAELERKGAALRAESARLDWLEAENADIEANRSGIEIGGWYGASGRSLREQIDSARALTSTPEAATVEACYCTPGVYTPSAMCPVHGATWPDPDEPHAFKMARDCRCYWCGKVSSHAIHRATTEPEETP